MVSLKQFRRYAKLYEGLQSRILVSVSLALARAVGSAFFALSLGKLISATLNPNRMHLTERMALLSVLLAVSTAGFSFGVRYNVIILSQTVVRDLRCKLIAALLKLDRDQLAHTGRAELQTVLLRDTENVDRMTSSLIGVAIPAWISISALALVAVWISPIYGAASLAVASLLWLPNRALRKSIEINIAHYAGHFSTFSKGILQTLERLAVIQSSHLEKMEYAEREKESDVLFKAGITTDWNITMVAEVLALLGNLATVALLAVGGSLAVHHTSIGDVLSICMILLLIRSQASGLSMSLPDVRTGGVSLGRIWSFLDAGTADNYIGQQQIEFKGNVKVALVSFGFNGIPLLEDISLNLKPGTCVALTGPNGAGKTTLLNLILGHLTPNKGALFAEGVSYDHADLSCLRTSVGYVPQDPVIFSGTIRQNISYGHPDSAIGDLEHAAEISGVAEFVQSLRGGYDTQVGDEGALLSGGQKQRMVLARALMSKPSLLILDEPTNHLDASSVLDLIARLFRASNAPAIFVISHDPAILAVADEVHELRSGRLKPYLVPRLKLVPHSAP